MGQPQALGANPRPSDGSAPYALAPPPAQAVLDPGAKPGARAWLKCKVQEGPELVVAALREGATEAQSLDLVFDQYSEFSVQGTAAVHITGAALLSTCPLAEWQPNP